MQVYTVVDRNVIRFLSRIYGIKTAVISTEGKKEIYALLSDLIDQDQYLLRKVKTLNRSQFIRVTKKSIGQYPLPRLLVKYLTENLNI